MDRTSQRFFCLSEMFSPTGQAEWTTPGTFQWLCPAEVFSVSAVAIGAGMGSNFENPAGGGLGWRASISTVPGTLYNVKVGSPTSGDGNSFFISEAVVCGRRGVGTGVGGTFVGDGGGNGGDSGKSGGSFGYYGAGAGGAGGYAGKGGNGGDCRITPSSPPGFRQNGTAGQAGAGGGGGGGGGGTYNLDDSGRVDQYKAGGGGGGTGIYGQGSSGLGGAGGNSVVIQGQLGQAGSNGTNGTSGTGAKGGNGGLFGGGAGITWANVFETGTTNFGSPGVAQGGAVRIIWGQGRFYPSNRTANE